MKREHLEHIIRAISVITNEYEFVIIGSQSILGTIVNPSELLCQSMEADVYALHNEEYSHMIDGTIGEGSPFHEHYHYYAQGVGSDTAILPVNWKTRLVKIQNENTDLKIGYCLDVTDLAVAKLMAGRDKDWIFVEELLNQKYIQPNELILRLDEVDPIKLTSDRKKFLINWINAHSINQNQNLSNDFGSS